MADDSIRNLLQALKEAYPSSVMPYGQAFENAETYPPGDYIFTGQFSLDEVLELVRKYFEPETDLRLLFPSAPFDSLAVVAHLSHSHPVAVRCEHDHGPDRGAILSEWPFSIETESEYQHVAVP
jgi:hypothetical protein